MNRYIVIASRDELPLVDRIPVDTCCPTIITGIGALNVVRALKDLPCDSQLFNIGYAGSPDIPIGTMVQVGECHLKHKVDYEEPCFLLGEGVKCYTSTDFVTEDAERGCVYDMELAFMCALGFAEVKSYKVISDNCNYTQYKQAIND